MRWMIFGVVFGRVWSTQAWSVDFATIQQPISHHCFDAIVVGRDHSTLGRLDASPNFVLAALIEGEQ